MVTHSEPLPTSIDWDAALDESVGIFKDLLRIETVNPPGNERPAAEYIANLFAREGIEHVVLESAPTRASVVGRLPATSSSPRGALLLNGHLDVVPVDREHWKHDPFAAVEAEGCIWGRGTIDMKNMVAMSVMTMLLIKRHKLPLSRPLIFAGVADEEAGSNYGALFLVDKHAELVKSEYVLNEVGGHTLHFGDTRFYPIQVSEKGICWFELTAEGEPGHGSMPHEQNAVVKLARAIERLGRIRLPQHTTPVVEGFIRRLAEGSPFPGNKVMPMLLKPGVSTGLLQLLSKKSPDQAMGINAMLRNTASPTILNAGSKVNVIPSQAKARVDGRIIPGQSLDSFIAEIQRVIGPDVRVNVIDHHDGTVFSADTPLYDTLCDTLRIHDASGVPVPYMIPGFTDSFAYARLGATCYGFSPVRLGPDLNFTRMYHGHNERIPIDGYRWGQRVLFDVVSTFCRT